MNRPWGVHAIGDIYHPDVKAQDAGGVWVNAVCVPYRPNLRERIRAAWWVFTGSAVAFVWPKVGDLENIWRRRPDRTQPGPSRPFIPIEPGQKPGALLGDDADTPFYCQKCKRRKHDGDCAEYYCPHAASSLTRAKGGGQP